MEWWHAIVLGLVEGITEYLPVSSTGHLILASSLLGLDRPEIKAAVDDFNIVVQGGAILAVVALYWPRVVQMFRGVIGVGAGVHAPGLRLFINLVIAFIPSAAAGFLLHDWIEAKLFHAGPVLAAVLAGGLYMLVMDAWSRGRLSPPRAQAAYREIDDVTPGQALLIGVLQCVALWPGTSRSMMTITGGLMVGLRPRAAAEFSFLLGLPTLLAATAYSLYKNLKHAARDGHPNLFQTLGPWTVTLGMVVATVSAMLAVKWLVGFLNRRGLAPFGWYRLALFVVLTALLWRGLLHVAK